VQCTGFWAASPPPIGCKAAFKLLYLALEHIAKKWTMPIRDWKAALQRFAILRGERLTKAGLL